MNSRNAPAGIATMIVSVSVPPVSRYRMGRTPGGSSVNLLPHGKMSRVLILSMKLGIQSLALGFASVMVTL